MVLMASEADLENEILSCRYVSPGPEGTVIGEMAPTVENKDSLE